MEEIYDFTDTDLLDHCIGGGMLYNWVISVTDNGVEQVAYGYDAVGRLVQKTGGLLRSVYDYDGDGNISMLKTVLNDKALIDNRYRYEDTGVAKSGYSKWNQSINQNKSAVIFQYDGLGRRIEKCITKAGSEKDISFTKKNALAEESKWETIGGVRIRRRDTELQKPHVVQGDASSVYAEEGAVLTHSGQNASVVEKAISGR